MWQDSFDGKVTINYQIKKFDRAVKLLHGAS